MKRTFYLFFMLIIFLFSSCVSSVKVMRTNSDSRLEKNEGYIVLRIINPTANKIIDEFFDAKGKRREGIEPLHLNSDLIIKRAPFSFSEFYIANSEPREIVVLKARKGTYGIINVGKNSRYFNPYIFKVVPGVVNYAGDIVIRGKYRLGWKKATDYYDLSIEDNFCEIQELRENSLVLLHCAEYEFIDQSKKVEITMPFYLKFKKTEKPKPSDS